QWFHLPLRLIWDAARAPLVGRRRRWALIRAFLAAGARWRANRPGAGATAGAAREREFFRRFHPQRMRTSPEPGDLSYWPRPFRVDVSEPTAPAAAPLLQRQSAGEAQR
ncbi:MAG: hypothetical protein PHO07_05120, partial [Pirellulales bacterium]|nr:hypothetical protein [Pirellulales bacterium]